VRDEASQLEAVVPAAEKAAAAASTARLVECIPYEALHDSASRGVDAHSVHPYDHVRLAKQRIGPPDVDAFDYPARLTQDRFNQPVSFVIGSQRPVTAAYPRDLIQMKHRGFQERSEA
jgi:hypothetical protein